MHGYIHGEALSFYRSKSSLLGFFFASPHFIVKSVTSVGKSNCATSNLINVGVLAVFIGWGFFPLICTGLVNL